MEKQKTINIVYASQTGTAYDLAKEFILTFAYQFKYNLINIQHLQQLINDQNNLWVFFVSTTGQGDPPYSMRNFWKKIMMKSYPNQKGLFFSIYALGDRSYGDNFCLTARKLRQRLISLQASQIVQIGLGDDQQKNGYLQQYQQAWFPKIRKQIQQFSQKVEHNINRPISFETELKSQNNCNIIEIVDRTQICENKGRRTFLIDLRIKNIKQPAVSVKMGDILCLQPHNNPMHVQRLLSYFKMEVQSKDQSNDKTFFCGRQISQYELFSQVLNISSYVNHSFFVCRPDLRPLSEFSSNQMFKQKLKELQTDFDQYDNYIKKYKRNVIEVIDDFQLKIPFKDFVSRIGFISHRKYSVSQILSTQNNQTVIRLLIRLTQQKISQFRMHNGICTHDLAIWSQIGSTRKGQIIKGQFQYNENNNNKIILITLGTGIAPFVQLLNQAKNSSNTWNITLYFTNRFRNQLYYEQLLQTLNKFQILQSFLEFTGEGGKRIVRLIQENLLNIKEFYQDYAKSDSQNKVNTNFKIMICGPKTTCQGIQNILQKHLNLDIKMLKKKKVLVYQNW